MDKRLLCQGLIKYFSGLILLGILLFLPAGTFQYPGAWLLLGLLFIPMLFSGIVLYVKVPELLRKRLNAEEKEDTQKKVVGLSALMFVAAFVIAGLDYRFGWSDLPVVVRTISSVVLLISYGLYAEVMRENAYLSRTIEVQKNQKVVDTGLYGIVRHPMYSVTIFLFLSIPLVLGSLVSFVIFLLYPIALVLRIQNEEEVLEEGLEGYTEYKKKVKYRLIPFVW